MSLELRGVQKLAASVVCFRTADEELLTVKRDG